FTDQTLSPAIITTLSLHDALPIWEDRVDIDHIRIGPMAIVQARTGRVEQTQCAREIDQTATSKRSLVDAVQRSNETDRLSEIDADRKSTRLNSSHVEISYAVFCLR